MLLTQRHTAASDGSSPPAPHAYWRWRSPPLAYSPAMSIRRERWTEARLVRFLRDVNRAYPGAAMPQPDADLHSESLARFLAARQHARDSEARP